MADIDTLRTLAERLDSHMGKQDVAVLLNDCRAASVGILALLDRLDRATELLESVAPLSDENSPIRNWLRAAHP